MWTRSTIGDWVVPGLVLGVGFGAGSTIAAYGVLRRPSWSWLSGVERVTGHHWSWIAALALGLGQVVWILLELAYLPEGSPQAIYGATGLVFLVLPLLRSVRLDLSATRRSAGCRRVVVPRV